MMTAAWSGLIHRVRAPHRPHHNVSEGPRSLIKISRCVSTVIFVLRFLNTPSLGPMSSRPNDESINLPGGPLWIRMSRVHSHRPAASADYV